MIATIGEALDLDWKLTVACRWGKRDGMKSIRECQYRHDLDLLTLVWTRGRAFPLAGLETRMRCPRCGSRRVSVFFQPPSNTGRASATAG